MGVERWVDGSCASGESGIYRYRCIQGLLSGYRDNGKEDRIYHVGAAGSRDMPPNNVESHGQEIIVVRGFGLGY